MFKRIKFGGCVNLYNGGFAMLKNLWKETVSALNMHGKTWDDVRQVQASGSWFDLNDVAAAFRATLYHTGIQGDEVAQDLVIVGDNWAMRWAGQWVWMEVPELLGEDKKQVCPVVFSTANEVDEDGCSWPRYNLYTSELQAFQRKKM